MHFHRFFHGFFSYAFHGDLLPVSRLRQLPPERPALGFLLRDLVSHGHKELGKERSDLRHRHERLHGHPRGFSFSFWALGFEKTSSWTSSGRLMSSMRQLRSLPNLYVTNSFMSAMGEKSWPEALEAFRGLEESDDVSFGACLSACGAGRCWREALGALARRLRV